MSIEEEIEALADAGLLTERQAEAWVLRRVELVPREAAAESMGIAPSTLDKHLAVAKEQIEAAEETLAVLEDFRTVDAPEECDVCSRTIAGTWVEDDDGTIMCPQCADVDLDAALGPDY